MAYVYKQINRNEITITPFKVHKTFTISNTNASGSYGVHVYQAIYNHEHVEISSDNPSLTADNRSYKFISHASLNQLYYENFEINPLEKLDYYHTLEKRELHEKAIAFSIPQNIFADRIKESTVELNIAGNTVVEDGYGNLYDSGRKNTVGSLLEDTNERLVSQVDFNECYLKGEKLVDTGSLMEKPYNPIKPFFKNLKFVDGTYGKQAQFQGSDSGIVIHNLNNRFDFNYNRDFFVSMMLNCPESQSHTTGQKAIVKKGWVGPYPFGLDIETSGSNYGKLIFSRYDGVKTDFVLSTISVSDGITRHIGLRKSGSSIELWIDGTLDNSTSGIGSGDILNDYPLYLGWNFTGSIDEFKVFDDSFTSTQVGNYGTYESSSTLNYHVGNVFYETGLVTITSPYSEYANLSSDTGSYTFTCRGTRDIEEYEVLCQVEGSEFNYTTNKSAATQSVSGFWEYDKNIVDNNNFRPYITQIGLYNNQGDLLLIAKTSQPIRIPNDKDLTFVVKFDI